MESSVRDDKIEEEGNSRKHTDEVNNPTPVDAAAGAEVNAGSDNSSKTVVVGTGGKRKEDEMMMMQPPSPIESSLKRICVSPQEEDSSDEPLPGNTDDLDHLPPPQAQKAGQRNQVDQIDEDVGSDADSDADDVPWRFRRLTPKSIAERTPTKEEWDKFDKEVEASQGFDADFCYRIHMTSSHIITTVDPDVIERDYEDFKHLMELAAAEASKGLVGQVLDNLQIVKATTESADLGRHHYITFIAKGSLDGVVRCYQAKVTRASVSVYDRNQKCIVEFVWLKDERGQVTAEDRKQIEGCDEDSIRQFYMDAFCPILPVNQEEIYADHEVYKLYMQLAADKACMDLDGQKLKGLRLVEAYQQLFGSTTHYYFTFTAKGSLDGECRTYRAKVITTWIESEPKDTLEFVRLKDEVTAEEWVDERVKHRKLAEARKVFDVDFSQRTNMNIDGVIKLVDAETIKGEDYNHFMELAAATACKGLGGQQLEELQMVEANEQSFGPTTKHHYITFTAKGSLDGKCRRYRAKVSSTYYKPKCECESESEYECECECESEPELKLKESVEYMLLEDEHGEFVWLEDDHYQALVNVNASQSSNLRLKDDHGLVSAAPIMI